MGAEGGETVLHIWKLRQVKLFGQVKFFGQRRGSEGGTGGEVDLGVDVDEDAEARDAQDLGAELLHRRQLAAKDGCAGCRV